MLSFYTVREGECECSDYLRHGSGHPCKHRLALFLHRSLEYDARGQPWKSRAIEASEAAADLADSRRDTIFE